MAHLTIGARRHAIGPGETTLGGADGAISVPGAESGPPVGVLRRGSDGSVTLRRLRADIDVLVDGVSLADQPRLLAHGAKVEILGRTLFFGDARGEAGTEPVAGLTDDALSALHATLPPQVAADSGGRLIALGGGREWAVPDEGLDIGRDPACDVVVAGADASRWHATVERTLLDYVVRDTSANGIRVNGVRVEGSRALAPGDVLRIGDEEFRFDADAPPTEPARETDGSSEALLRPPARSVRPPARPPLLATLEITNAGPRSGERIRIEREPVRIGRSSRAEIVFADDSISGTHATLERRDGAWTVVDHDSTNGTYVDGERIFGARRLAGAAELRFGNVKTIFRPIAAASVASPTTPAGLEDTADTAADTASTRGIVGLTDEQLRRMKRRR